MKILIHLWKTSITILGDASPGFAVDLLEARVINDPLTPGANRLKSLLTVGREMRNFDF